MKHAPSSSRRDFLRGAAASSALALSSCSTFLAHQKPRDPSPGARAFAQRMFEGLDRRRVWDSHVHLVGIGTNESGCVVHPSYRDDFVKRFKFDLYMQACGVTDLENADAQYLARLMKLVHLMNPRGSVLLLAFDFRVDDDGSENREKSEVHTPNEYLYRVAERFPAVRACPSVHPYRKDALARLDEAKERGAVAVKWLPNAQVIDPALPRLDPYYRKLAEHGLVLLTHAGHEAAVESQESQSYGNVLKLRRALDSGVKVIVAHAAGLGDDVDLDARAAEKAEMAAFDLFLRLMGEKQYEGRLFGDISAMTQVNRSGRPLRELVQASELHARLVNGSDYPLPAINPLVSTRWLERHGYLEREERMLCNEVYRANPLLFDFVVKRALRVREGSREWRFADVVFESGRVFAA